MNGCPICSTPVPRAIEESPAFVEYCPRCSEPLYLAERSGPPQTVPV